jgi:hypothetical protein
MPEQLVVFAERVIFGCGRYKDNHRFRFCASSLSASSSA